MEFNTKKGRERIGGKQVFLYEVISVGGEVGFKERCFKLKCSASQSFWTGRKIIFRKKPIILRNNQRVSLKHPSSTFRNIYTGTSSVTRFSH